MKVLKSSLAVICLLLLLVVAVSALVSQHNDKLPVSRRVYVDVDRLATMHPAWKQVMCMRESIRELEASEKKSSQLGVAFDGAWSYRPRCVNVDVPDRDGLTRQIERKALNALSRVEAFEREKIDRELARKRAELEANVRAEITEKTRVVNDRIAEERRSIDLKRSQGRIDAELKIAAIRSRVNALNETEEQKASAELAAARSELALYDQESVQAVEELSRGPKEELNGFAEQAKQRMDSNLSDFLRDRENRMFEDIKRQRDETIVQLRDDSLMRSVGKSISPDSESIVRSKLPSSMKHKERDIYIQDSISRLRKQEQDLVNRIRRDVVRIAKATAQKRRLSVCFGVRPVGVADFTGEVASVLMPGGSGLQRTVYSGR